MRPRHPLASVAALVLVLTSSTGLAAAEEPAGIAVGLDATRLLNQSYVPVLSFGAPVSLQAQSSSGQPVLFDAGAGCTVQSTPSTISGWTTAILTPTSATEPCRLTLATAAGNGFAESTSTYYLRTRPGQQVAALPSLARKVAPETSVTLGPSGLATDRGQPIAFRVAKGSKHCSIAKVKSKVTVAFAGKQGQCTVWASASGIPGQYLPFQRAYVFNVTKSAQAGTR